MVLQVATPKTESLEITELTPKKQYRRTPDGRKEVGDIFASFESKSEYRFVPLDKLEIDHAYQRGRDDSRISKMAHAWNQDLCGVIIVNQRANGSLYVIDGQQRVAAMRLTKNSPARVLAQLFTGLTIEQEAELFKDLDTQRLGLTTGSVFAALVVARDPAALEIQDAAHKAGLTLDPKRGDAPNNLRAFGAIMGIHRRSGKDMLARIFKIVSAAWPENRYWGAGNVLKGLEVFLTKYPDINDRHLIEALARTTPRDIENKARTLSEALSSALSRWVGRVIFGLYNLGLKKNRLPDWD